VGVLGGFIQATIGALLCVGGGQGGRGGSGKGEEGG